MKKLSYYFFQGLIFLAPIAISVYVFYWIFVTVDSLLGLPIKGAGFVATLASITLLGFLASNFITKSILGLLEKLLSRLPFVRLLHSSIRDVLTAFVGERKGFDKPVMVRLFPGADTAAFGFVTSESLEQFGLQDYVSVYLPQSYNFAGNILVVRRNQVEPLPGESARVMAFIISGGISGRGLSAT